MIYKHICLTIGLQTVLITLGTEPTSLKTSVTEGRNCYKVSYSLIPKETYGSYESELCEKL